MIDPEKVKEIEFLQLKQLSDGSYWIGLYNNKAHLCFSKNLLTKIKAITEAIEILEMMKKEIEDEELNRVG